MWRICFLRFSMVFSDIFLLSKTNHFLFVSDNISSLFTGDPRRKVYAVQLLLCRRQNWLLQFGSFLAYNCCHELLRESQRQKEEQIQKSNAKISFEDAYRLYCGQSPVDVKCCEVCGKREGLRRCKTCKKACYCSRDCQARDWSVSHRLHCHPSTTITEFAQ